MFPHPSKSHDPGLHPRTWKMVVRRQTTFLLLGWWISSHATWSAKIHLKPIQSLSHGSHTFKSVAGIFRICRVDVKHQWILHLGGEGIHPCINSVVIFSDMRKKKDGQTITHYEWTSNFQFTVLLDWLIGIFPQPISALQSLDFTKKMPCLGNIFQ